MVEYKYIVQLVLIIIEDNDNSCFITYSKIDSKYTHILRNESPKKFLISSQVQLYRTTSINSY
jgi:hypothetical protein